MPAGCGGAIRAPGTEDLPPEALAEIYVPRHTGAIAGDGGEAHVIAITLGARDGPSYEIGGSGESFLLTPGEHHVSLRYGICRHWPATWFKPFDRLLAHPPYGWATLDAQAGRHYELRCAYEGWNSGPHHRHWFEERP